MGILICGLNGTGKSTAGKILAERLGYAFIDNEELYFPKNDPSYEFSKPRSKAEVIELLDKKIHDNNNFVFAAVKGDYGDKLIEALDTVVLIELPRGERLERVKNRSFQKFGNRMLQGGDLYEKEGNWLSYVASRPEDLVEEWVLSVKCPVIRVDGRKQVNDTVDYLLSVLRG